MTIALLSVSFMPLLFRIYSTTVMVNVCDNGTLQSPIDFTRNNVHLDSSISALTLRGYKTRHSNVELQNTGHTVMITLDAGKSPPSVTNGPLKQKKYDFVQAHFHWGRNTDVGSEHTIEGQHFSGEVMGIIIPCEELHLVHAKSGLTLDKGLEYSDGVTVLGVFLEESDTDNIFFNPIIEMLSSVRSHSSSTKLKTSLVLRDLLPHDISNFFSYNGSLTTPPCSEAVNWIVFTYPVPIGMNQINKFRHLLSHTHDKNGTYSELVDNFRKVLPLNDRIIKLRKRVVYGFPAKSSAGRWNFMFSQFFAKFSAACNGRLSFEIMTTDDFFKSYQNTTGSSVSDCVDRCYRKFQFCHAVRYDKLQKTCFYSYKSPMRCQGKDQESLAAGSDGKASATVSCITCIGGSQKIESAKKIAEPNKITQSTKSIFKIQTGAVETSEFSTSTISLTTSTSTIPSTTTLKTTIEPSTTSATKTSTFSETVRFTTLTPAKPEQISSAERFTVQTTKVREAVKTFVTLSVSTTVPTTELTTQITVDQSNSNNLIDNRIDNSIDENVLKKKSAKFVKNLQPLSVSKAQELSPRFGTKCNTDLQSPCSKGVGRDCSLVEGAACQICKCPLRGAARGCLGPYGLNETYRIALLTDVERCPNGRRPQKVFRFQRVENPMTDDLCDAVMQPYCGYQLDKGAWRMPRSVDECHFFCFTDQELQDNNIEVKNLQQRFSQ